MTSSVFVRRALAVALAAPALLVALPLTALADTPDGAAFHHGYSHAGPNGVNMGSVDSGANGMTGEAWYHAHAVQLNSSGAATQTIDSAAGGTTYTTYPTTGGGWYQNNHHGACNQNNHQGAWYPNNHQGACYLNNNQNSSYPNNHLVVSATDRPATTTASLPVSNVDNATVAAIPQATTRPYTPAAVSAQVPSSVNSGWVSGSMGPADYTAPSAVFHESSSHANAAGAAVAVTNSGANPHFGTWFHHADAVAGPTGAGIQSSTSAAGEYGFAGDVAVFHHSGAHAGTDGAWMDHTSDSAF